MMASSRRRIRAKIPGQSKRKLVPTFLASFPGREAELLPNSPACSLLPARSPQHCLRAEGRLHPGQSEHTVGVCSQL